MGTKSAEALALSALSVTLSLKLLAFYQPFQLIFKIIVATNKASFSVCKCSGGTVVIRSSPTTAKGAESNLAENDGEVLYTHHPISCIYVTSQYFDLKEPVLLDFFMEPDITLKLLKNASAFKLSALHNL